MTGKCITFGLDILNFKSANQSVIPNASAIVLTNPAVLVNIVLGFEPWKFIVYGDTRNNPPRRQHSEVLQSIVAITPDYKFIINVGDIVDHGEIVAIGKHSELIETIPDYRKLFEKIYDLPPIPVSLRSTGD